MTKINEMVDRESLGKIFSEYRKKIDELIAENISALGEKSSLRDSCEYALKNGGKRFRPTLVLLVAKSLNPLADVSQAALAIEYLHTASLIADDLPCMDDDKERRGHPSLHVVYDEAIALLASYGLIAAGYGCLATNSEQLKSSSHPYANRSDEICRLALENVAYNSGLRRTTGGQFLDIYPPELTLENVKDILCKKTVSLFEVSFVLGWLYSGGEVKLLPQVKKAAFHFGMAFQIADDIEDMEQDVANGRKVNLALLLGKDEAKELCMEEVSQCERLLEELKIDTAELKAVLYHVGKGLNV